MCTAQQDVRISRAERDGDCDAAGEHDREDGSHGCGHGVLGRACMGRRPER